MNTQHVDTQPNHSLTVVNEAGTHIRLNERIINQANLIAEYDPESAKRYIQLITSKKYLERSSSDGSKRLWKEYSPDELEAIKQRVLNRTRHSLSCPVCGDEPKVYGYCCHRCRNIGARIKREYKQENKLKAKQHTV